MRQVSGRSQVDALRVRAPVSIHVGARGLLCWILQMAVVISVSRLLLGRQRLRMEDEAGPVLRTKVSLLQQAQVLRLVLLEAPQLQVLITQLNLYILVLSSAHRPLGLCPLHLLLFLQLQIDLLMAVLMHKEFVSRLALEPIDLLLLLQD